LTSNDIESRRTTVEWCQIEVQSQLQPSTYWLTVHGHYKYSQVHAGLPRNWENTCNPLQSRQQFNSNNKAHSHSTCM